MEHICASLQNTHIHGKPQCPLSHVEVGDRASRHNPVPSNLPPVFNMNRAHITSICLVLNQTITDWQWCSWVSDKGLSQLCLKMPGMETRSLAFKADALPMSCDHIVQLYNEKKLLFPRGSSTQIIRINPKIPGTEATSQMMPNLIWYHSRLCSSYSLDCGSVEDQRVIDATPYFLFVSWGTCFCLGGRGRWGRTALSLSVEKKLPYLLTSIQVGWLHCFLMDYDGSDLHHCPPPHRT